MLRSSYKGKNPYIIEGIQINNYLLKKYLSRVGEKKLIEINDLSQLNTKTDSEILRVLEHMIKTKNYFKYCASLLLNINPGPKYIYDYLNLKKWIPSISSSSHFTNQEKKPHLYSFMQYVYETMIKENQDQVVSLLGPIGSGKTFNLIHIIEFFTNMYGPKNYQTEIFEMFHNSIQLIHIFGSIYRENNIESTSCGLLVKLGFNQNNIICSFSIESQIFDLSLPFSENGRSFNILHSFINGANSEMKKNCKLPKSDEYLSFFSKFLSKFSEKMREKLTINDLEIWNRFYSLSKYFKFTSDEIIDIVQCLALVLNLNELTISKIQVEKEDTKEKKEKNDKKENKENKENKKNKENKEYIDYFEIQRGKTCKKICQNLNINIDDFLSCLSRFKTLQEAKNFIISLMKQTYYIVFDFILSKIKHHVNLYFTHLNKRIGTNNFKKIKNIFFVDFPGEISDKTLGGFTTNIASECLNMYSATGFYEVAEKLIRENIYLDKFYPIKSYFAVSTCMEKGGLLDHFTKQLNRQNFNSLINNCLSKKNFMNCIKFSEKKSFEENDYNFLYNFSHKKIEYNYETLFLETKSLLINDTITKIFSLTENYVIKSIYKEILINKSKDFYSFFTKGLCKIFEPIQNIKPFIVFCFHSNYSYKIIFKDRNSIDNNIDNINMNITKDKKTDPKNTNKKKPNIVNYFFKEEEIPKDITLEIIKNSFIFPILFWNLYGYKEWIHIDEFIQEYSIDFEKVKNRIIHINNLDPERKKFESNIILDFNQLPKEEVAKCTLSILSKEGDFLIGKNYIIMKQGTLNKMRIYLNGMIDTAEIMSQNLKLKLDELKKEKENEKIIKGRKSIVFIPLKIEKKLKNKFNNNKKSSKENKNNTNENNKKNNNNKKLIEDIKLEYEKFPLPNKKEFKSLEEDNSRRHLLKEQCIINIISNGKIINSKEKNKIMKSKKFNLYNIISRRDKILNGLENEYIKDDIDFEELPFNLDNQDNNNEKEKDKERDKDYIITDSSSIIKNKKYIDKIKKKASKIQEYYAKNINNIIKIQAQIRKMISKNKYIILKYIYSEIILLQKFVRGHLTRVKFRKFLDCLEKIKLIQYMYHRRHVLKVRSATKIQEFWLKRLKIKKYKEKLIAKKRAKEKGEYYDMDLESFEDFSNNNYRLENYLRRLELQKNKENITKKLLKEKDPKKIVQMILYGGGDGVPPEKKISRAQKYGFDLNIEDKLLKQGEIMKKRKQDLADTYHKQFLEKNPYAPRIPTYNSEILGNKYPGEFLKRMEFYQLFKEKNLEKLRNDTQYNENKKGEKEKSYNTYNNSEKSSLPQKKNYERYIQNAFDRLHNEQIQIEHNKRRKSQINNINMNYYNDLLLNNKDNKKNKDNMNLNTIKKNMTFKKLIMNDKIKRIKRNSWVGDIKRQNEIWPKQLQNNFLTKENVKITEREEKKSYESSKQKSMSESEDNEEKEKNDFFN